MIINEWVIGSIIVVVIVVGYGIIHQQRSQPPLSLEGLRIEVEDLRETSKKQAATIETLQNLLYEKDRQNAALQQKIAVLEQQVRVLEMAVPVTTAPKQSTHPDELLVVVGDDPALEVDVAVLRSSDITAKFRLVVKRRASKRWLADTLQRYRSRGFPIKQIHLSVHGNEEGILLDGEIASGIWLSENLSGVEIAVITGCSTSTAANLARVVPVVVSMSSDVGMNDAMEFSGAFWSQIAAGNDPEDAFYEAVQRVPGAGELAEPHIRR